MTPAPTRIWIAEVELSQSLAPTGVSRSPHPADTSARLLVRLHHQFLGFVTLPLRGELDEDSVWAAIKTELAEPLRCHLERDGHTLADGWPSTGIGDAASCAYLSNAAFQASVSVVVCTRDRPTILANCLTLLMQLQYPNVEIIVVDNAPTTDESQACFERLVGADRRFRYVREPVPGLSRARNRGLREATTQYVTFTDDDVRVDAWWINAIVAGFTRDPLAGCVTGLVPPAELDDPAQQFFDRRYSWASHLEPRVFDLAERRDDSALYPYSAGLFGTGANFAIDRELFIELGGFDEALGAGVPAGGGEDLDAFVRVLHAGRSIVYEPSALVWHVHRADASALRRQLFYYGAGLTAFLTKHVLSPRTGREIVARIPAGLRRGRSIWSPSEIGVEAPKLLILSEIAGMLAGPFLYIRGWVRLRRPGKQPRA